MFASVTKTETRKIAAYLTNHTYEEAADRFDLSVGKIFAIESQVIREGQA